MPKPLKLAFGPALLACICPVAPTLSEKPAKRLALFVEASLYCRSASKSMGRSSLGENDDWVVAMEASSLSVAPVVRTAVPPKAAAPAATDAPPAPVLKLVHRCGLRYQRKSSKKPNNRRSFMPWGRSRSFIRGSLWKEVEGLTGGWEPSELEGRQGEGETRRWGERAGGEAAAFFLLVSPSPCLLVWVN